MKAHVSSIVLLVVFAVLGLMLRASEAGVHASPGKDVVLYELNEQAAKRGTPLCTAKLMAHAELVFAQLGITVKDASRCTALPSGRATFTWTLRLYCAARLAASCTSSSTATGPTSPMSPSWWS